MAAVKVSASLIVLVTVVTGNEMVTKEDISRILNDFTRDVTRQMRSMEETIATMAIRVATLETEGLSVKQSCQDVGGYQQEIANNTDELEERVEILEATVMELNEDVNVAEDLIDSLQIDVNVITTDVTDLEARVETEEGTSQTHIQQITELHENFTALDNRLGTVEGTLHDIGNFSFLATMSNLTGSVVSGETIVFDEDRLNEGKNYDQTTGVYTVPVDGVYQFTVHLLSNNQVHGGCYLRVDGVRTAFTRHVDEAASDHPAELNVILDLTSGQTVYVENFVQTSIHGKDQGNGNMLSWFSAFLVKPY